MNFHHMPAYAYTYELALGVSQKLWQADGTPNWNQYYHKRANAA
jgi:hypothetical protein